MLDHLDEEDPKCVDDAEDDSIDQEAADHYEPGLGEKFVPLIMIRDCAYNTSIYIGNFLERIPIKDTPLARECHTGLFW